MHRNLFISFLSLSAILLTGCAAVNPDGSRLLPPQVEVTHVAASVPGFAPGLTTSPLLAAITTGPASSPFPALTLQEAAARTYGSRLIQQIDIPTIGVHSPVVTVGWRVEWTPENPGDSSAGWDSPGAAVGWVLTSALPDQAGNIILYGHNNVYGSVFKNLWKLAAGDEITLTTGQRHWQYRVDQSLLLPLLEVDEDAQRTYQAYLTSTDNPRLTLISCWPPASNTHRVVVIAHPIQIP